MPRFCALVSCAFSGSNCSLTIWSMYGDAMLLGRLDCAYVGVKMLLSLFSALVRAPPVRSLMMVLPRSGENAALGLGSKSWMLLCIPANRGLMSDSIY